MEKLKRSLSKDLDRKLEFFGTKSGGVCQTERDFSASMCVRERDTRVSMVFRNGVVNEISSNGRLEFAIDGSRLYFREAQNRGYKAVTKTNEKNCYIQSAHPAIIEFFKKYGNVDRDIKADNEMSAYFIEAGKEWI